MYADTLNKPNNLQDLVLYQHIGSGAYRYYPKSYADLPGIKADLVRVYNGQNLNTNPAFESVVAGSTVVRTNLCKNPNAFSAGGGYAVNSGGGTATGAYVSGATPTGSTYYRATWTAASTAFPYLEYNAGSGHGIVPGAYYTLSGWVRTSVPLTMVATLNLWNGTGSTLTTQSAGVNIVANTWTKLSVTSSAVAPAGTIGGFCDWNVSTGTVPIGGTIDVTGVLIEQTDQLRSYFDGSTPAALGMYYGWSNTVNASASTAQASAVTVRTNRCINPNFETDNGGWTAESLMTFTRDTTTPISGTASGKMTNGGDIYTIISGVAAGESWTLSLDYKTSGTVTGVPKLYLSDNVTNTNTFNLPLTQVTPGRFSITMPVTAAGTTSLIAAVFGPNGAGVAWIDNVLIERSATAQTYFDGSTPSLGDCTNAWSGAVNGSASTQLGTTLPGLIAGNTAMISSQDWSGRRSMRMVTAGPSNVTFVYQTYPTTIGKTYTLLARVRLAAPLTGTLEYRSRQLMMRSLGSLDTYSAVAPNVAGETVLRVKGVATAATSNFYFFSGASAGNGDVWVDEWCIVEGDYDGPYFDGDSARGVWLGTPHASVSMQTVPDVRRNPNG